MRGGVGELGAGNNLLREEQVFEPFFFRQAEARGERTRGGSVEGKR